ncbi:MAG: hypothetical protein IPO21_14470 [Bacteroidales bacterium]|nr:hypothetical protein [Bacteroidales bacterium]
MSNDIDIFKKWQNDWCLFAKDVLKANLDKQQQEILHSVQINKMTTVVSGTARGKDYVAAVAAVCFLYLTPVFGKDGSLIKNTKVALTAPTDRQVKNIMIPEVRRLINNAKVLPARLTGYDIRTDYDEWFLTGFKADEYNHEAWSGFHAANTMFVVTEATGLPDTIFYAIEGNLQGNSRLLLVMNGNTSTGYAANSHRSPRFNKFRLSSLDAPNVLAKKEIISGQVDYEWIVDKVKTWCTKITKNEFNEGNGDFEFENEYYRPDDIFRVKVLGMFPKISEGTLIPIEWILQANERWKEIVDIRTTDSIFGADVAGMGKDKSVICERKDNYVYPIESYTGTGSVDYTHFTGVIANKLKNNPNSFCFIDTIGEGAGLFHRLKEMGYNKAISCKNSESAADLHDITGTYNFYNMRAYIFWCARSWFNPAINPHCCFPPDDEFLQEATAITWFFNGDKVQIEKKEDIKKRINRSTDKFDSFANTFYPCYNSVNDEDDLIYRLLG